MAGGTVNVVSYGKRNLVLKKKPVLTKYKSRHNARRKNVSKCFGFKGPALVQKNINPFGNEFYTKMRYNNYSGIACPAGGVAGGVNYRMNSMFDPDLSGAGHQPYQYDQVASVYTRCIVYACKVEIVWNNPSGDGYMGGFSVTGSNGGTNPSGLALDRIRELPNNYIIRLNNTGSQTKKKTIFIKNWVVEGVTKAQYFADVANYSELMPAGPSVAKTVIGQLYAIEPYGTTPTCGVEVTLTYYARCYGRKDPGQS